MEKITRAVCEYYGIQYDNIFLDSRCSEFVTARQMVMYIAYELFKFTHSEAARFFKQDHSTCVYAVKKVTGELQVYKRKREELNGIRFKIYEGKLPDASDYKIQTVFCKINPFEIKGHCYEMRE